jgi:hypothetical protein
MPVTEKTLVVHRELTPVLRHRVDAGGRYAALQARVAEVLVAADTAGLERDAGRKRMREWLRTTGLSASDRILTEVIRRRKGIDDD